jgi:hypothetical protein
MLAIALLVAGSGCARATRSEGTSSAHAVSPTRVTIEQACQAHGTSCLAALEQARVGLAKGSFEDLMWCASMARSTASFQACLDANWEGGVFVMASVTPANLLEPTRSTATGEPPRWHYGNSDLTEDQKAERAKQLFLEAEALAEAGDWVAAVPSYEEAYYLVPGKHGFAFKVGVAAFKAGDCDKANEYLRHFVTYGDPHRNADKLEEAKMILGEISVSGCASSR